MKFSKTKCSIEMEWNSIYFDLIQSNYIKSTSFRSEKPFNGKIDYLGIQLRLRFAPMSSGTIILYTFHSPHVKYSRLHSLFRVMQVILMMSFTKDFHQKKTRDNYVVWDS